MCTDNEDVLFYFIQYKIEGYLRFSNNGSPHTGALLSLPVYALRSSASLIDPRLHLSPSLP